MKNAFENAFDWAIVGAGPAGIAAVGKLIDQGISPGKIAWLDPHFNAGDLGAKWTCVPSNTSVELFLRFLNDSNAFAFKERPRKFPIEERQLQDTCPLEEIADPLEWITGHLKKKVHALQEKAIAMNLRNGHWEIKLLDRSIHAKNAILAIGAEPKTQIYPGPKVISLEAALHPEKLKAEIGPEDIIGVFGSSHSAVLVLGNLLALNPKQVINFYRSPHRYAVDLKDWILYDDIGLKGVTAAWAKRHLDGELPKNLKRVLVSDRTFEEALILCNKAVYATGFERRKTPVLEQYDGILYDDTTGIIAPGLFGLGLAFPQGKFDPLGNFQHRVGLWKFMDFINTILPIWLKYANR